MLIIERVAILHKLDLFRETPDYVLASVARIVEEVSLNPGEVLLEEGAPGDSMYVIVEGRVRVHSRDKTIITLGPGTTVGELAVLDPEPRTASAVALDSAFLFRIDKEPFGEVLADRPEIALGVIRTLCRRLRAQGRQVAEPAEGPPPTDGP